MASTARQRSGLRGVSALRDVLKKLPANMRKDIGLVIAESAIKVHTDMYTLAPKDSGITASHIGSEISSDKLSARIGMLTLPHGFVARFLEFGTKGYTADTKIKSKRGKYKGVERTVYRRESGGQTHYGSKNVPPQPARPFITPALDINDTDIREAIHAAVSKVIGGTRLGKAFGYE